MKSKMDVTILFAIIIIIAGYFQYCSKNNTEQTISMPPKNEVQVTMEEVSPEQTKVDSLIQLWNQQHYSWIEAKKAFDATPAPKFDGPEAGKCQRLAFQQDNLARQIVAINKWRDMVKQSNPPKELVKQLDWWAKAIK